MLDWSFNGTNISSYKSKMEVLCKYFYWKLQIPWYSTMQFPFTHLAWLLWLCLLRCSGCQWMDLMRRSCERLEDNYSDLPVQRLNDLVSPVLAGLGWCIQTSPPAGQAPHTCCGQWCQLQQWSHPSNNNLPTTAVNHISRNTMFRDTCILAPSTCWK